MHPRFRAVAAVLLPLAVGCSSTSDATDSTDDSAPGAGGTSSAAGSTGLSGSSSATTGGTSASGGNAGTTATGGKGGSPSPAGGGGAGAGGVGGVGGVGGASHGGASGGGASGGHSSGGAGGAAGSAGSSASAGSAGSSASAGAAGSPAADCSHYLGAAMAKSEWVTADAAGKLTYKLTDRGDRILDFSHAGYMGGGVAIPTVPAVVTVNPSGKDDTAAIQAALDSVAKMPLSGGSRGAVLLASGMFSVSDTLHVTASGVVLRGSGSGASGTDIHITGAPNGQQMFLTFDGAGTWSTKSSNVAITDAYVPAGASSFHVDDASGFAVGDGVLVIRPVTDAWVKEMGMDKLVRDGMPQTWIKSGTLGRSDRVITAINGKEVTVDVPLADSYDAKFLSPPGASLSKYTFNGRISRVGIESLHVTAPKITTAIDQPHFLFVAFNAVEDGWMRDVVAEDFVGAGGTGMLQIAGTSKRISILDTALTHSFAVANTAGYPLDFTIRGSQVLVARSSVVGDLVYSLTTLTLASGPNAALDFTTKGSHSNISPHERWATGLLVDRSEVGPGTKHDSGIQLMNRGYSGSGHGWTMGWGVVWGSKAETFLIQQPPGSMAWAIGCDGKQTTGAAPGGDGTILPEGTIESNGTPVAPSSLYLAQLCDRLGPAAVAAIGYP